MSRQLQIHHHVIFQLENFHSMSRSSEIKVEFPIEEREFVFWANVNSCFSHQSHK